MNIEETKIHGVGKTKATINYLETAKKAVHRSVKSNNGHGAQCHWLSRKLTAGAVGTRYSGRTALLLSSHYHR